MRITLVSETYFPQVNGVSRTLDRLTRHLAACGDQVQLLIPDYGQEVPEGPEDVRFFRAFHPPFYRELHLPLAGKRKLQWAIESFSPDVTHIATEGPMGWSALRATIKSGLPLVTSYHTNYCQYLPSYRAGVLKPVAWRYLRWFHNHAAVTLCPSRSTRQMLQDKGFRRVDIWSRGVDSEFFSPVKRDLRLRQNFRVKEHETLLLYAGRVANEKNLPMLIEAFNLLLDDFPARLLIIGDGPLRSKLESENKNRRIIFAGYQKGEELARLYAASDFFVFPSLTETFGNVMLEAMSSGLPVLGFEVPGPRDLVQPGETGELTSEISADALAGLIKKTVKDEEHRRKMSSAARSYALEQSWEQVNEVVRRAYQRAAGSL